MGIVLNGQMRCFHDGGYCHHECNEKECFRKERGMELSTPYEGFPVHQKYEIINTAKDLIDKFYWQCFYSQIGSEFHSFIEFCGVMSIYVDIIKDSGKNPHTVNVHSVSGFEIEEHRVMYLAEKLGCILSPLLQSMSDKKKKEFLEKLCGEHETR